MRNQIEQPDETEEWDEAGFETPPWLEFERADESEPPAVAGGLADLDGKSVDPNGDLPPIATAPSSDMPREPFPADHPVQFAEDLKSVYDLEESFNAYGRTIYVETREETTGKPKVWYEFNKQKILVKYVRGPSVITHTYLGRTTYI
ncbi:MAG TPA: hypothetical protein VGJ02_03425 [Pyrinomonadaceae bacterium]